MIEFDASQVRALAKDLGDLPADVAPEVRAVVQKGALNIKQGWQSRWQGHAHAPSLPAAISYDTEFTVWGISAEIGPDKGKRQGALGNIYEYGTPKNAPMPAGMPALAEEAPKFEKALADVLTKLLR